MTLEEHCVTDSTYFPSKRCSVLSPISDSFVEYYESNGLTAAKVDAIAYVIE